jgi:glycosyltransferase involved in cell wall biosynthesis
MSPPLVLLLGDRADGSVEEALRGLLDTGPSVAGLIAECDLEGINHLLRLLRAAGADLVVTRSGAVVEPGWYETLRTSAYADSTIATASAMPRTRFENPETRSGAAMKYSLPIAGPAWGCVYVRRDALELAAPMLDDAFDAPELEAALDARLAQPGFAHRLTFTPVMVPGGRTADVNRLVASHPLTKRSLNLVDVGDRRLRVLLDGRCLAFPMSGTQVNVLSLVRSLATTQELDVGLLLPELVHPSIAADLRRIPVSVEREVAGRPTRPPDVFHRPYQLLLEGELGEVLDVAGRLVITQQDLILTRTRSYFTTSEDWERFAALTHLSLLAADHVAFFSEHARQQALEDNGLPLERTSVIPLGTEHLDDFRDREDLDKQPAQIDRRMPYLLVLGNAYAHKNRIFALRLFARLTREGLWDGALVLAGGHPPVGGSIEAERAYLKRNPEISGRVSDIGPVSEEEKRWLYRNAALVLYPSLYEGFGLVPFEAAALRTPAVYAWNTSLREFLPSEGALLDGWDVERIAPQVADLLNDDHRSQALVGALRKAAAALTWSRTAESYADVYRRVTSAPVGTSLVIGAHFTVSPRLAVAASRDEQRLLNLYRRSPAFRVGAGALLRGASWLRRVPRLVRASSRPGVDA